MWSERHLAEWIKATWNSGFNTHTDSEQYGVETTHTHTSITLNRCQPYNPWHSKTFHEFTGENRAQSCATLLRWWAHGWWIKTQLRETNGGLEKIGECPCETCGAGQKGKPVTAQETLGWLHYCPTVSRTWRCAANCYMFWYRIPSLGISVFFFPLRVVWHLKSDFCSWSVRFLFLPMWGFQETKCKRPTN